MHAGWSPRAPVTNRKPLLELFLVLGVSLGSSAIYSVLSILRSATSEAGIAGTTVAINRSLASNQWVDLGYQIAQNLIPLVPVVLAIYLIWLDSKPWPEAFGLTPPKIIRDTGSGILLATVIGIPGIALYLAARELGVAVNVEPSGLSEFWWTIPVLILAALKASILEEFIVVGFMFHQLRKIGLKDSSIVLVSAALRASYHLYQGLAGLIGNFVMGLVFGWLYKKNGRLGPLLIAHFVMDVAVFIAGPVLLSILN